MTSYLRQYSPPNIQRIQKKKKDLKSWLPVLAWVLLPLSYSYLSGFGTRPPGILSLRWIGLGLLALYGFYNLFLTKRWKPTGFDYCAWIIFSIAVITSIIHSGLFGTLKIFSCFLVYLSLTWGIGSLTSNFSDATVLTKRLLFTSAIIIAVGLIGNLSGLIPSRGGAPAGLLFNPNANAEMAAAFIPLAVWLTQQKRKDSAIGKVISYSILASLLTAVLISDNRSSLVALCSVVVYAIAATINRKTRDSSWTNIFIISLLSISVLGSMFLLNSPTFQSNLSQFVNENTDPHSSGITANRTNLLWPLYGEEIKQAPLLGYGWGSEELFLRTLRASSASYLLRGDAGGTAHSAYIGLTYQIGFIGSLMTFIPLWGAIFGYLKEASKNISLEIFKFRLALVSSMLVILVFSIFETGIYNMGSTFAFPFWVFAYLLCHSQKWRYDLR